MKERQGSRGYLDNYRSSGAGYKLEHTLLPSFSKRSLEDAPLRFRPNCSTPQHNPSAHFFPESPHAPRPPSDPLKDILSMTSNYTQGNSSNKKSNNVDSDSNVSHTDLFRSSDLASRRGLASSSNASRHDLDLTKIEYREERLYEENQRLWRENQQIKRQLQAARREVDGVAGLRAALEKSQEEKDGLQRCLERMGKRISELEKKSDINQQESYLYRDIIDQLEKRVAVLLQENQNLQSSVRISMRKLEDFDVIQDRLDKLRLQYKQLERAVQEDTNEWQLHKELWINEREYYKQIIRKLQFQLNTET